MALMQCLILLTLLNFHLSDVLGSCPMSNEKLELKYMMEQNYILNLACMKNERPHFNPIHDGIQQNLSSSMYQRAYNIISSYIEYDAAVRERISENTLHILHSRMSEIYNKAKVCVYEGAGTKKNGCAKKWPSEIYEVLGKNDTFDELKYYWVGLRDATGKRIRKYYEENNGGPAIPLSGNQYWLAEYEATEEEMLKTIDKAWQDLLPFYQQLHAYIRRKLITKYGKEHIKTNGPIPEHLLDEPKQGKRDLFAKDWWKVKDLVLPFSEEKYLLDIMQEQNMNISQLIEICEDFYKSLGFPALGEEFWQNNLKEISPEEPNCQDSVFVGCEGYDASLIVCHKEGSSYDFFYYMIQNFMSVYREKWINGHQECGWPSILNGHPNPGFENALKGLVDISVSTREYTRVIGLMDDNQMTPWDTEEVFNHLMKMALWNFVNLQYYYNIAKWRLDLSSGNINTQNMNTKWWEYSLKYRGVCPPVKRNESDFDPGALPEVAKSLPVVGDFLGGIYEYQFHKALCKMAGAGGSLQNCTIFKSKKAGDILKKVMDIGRKKPWEEVMLVITGGASAKLDTKPLLEYYQPLYEWLKEKNKDEVIGWESDDATVCP